MRRIAKSFLVLVVVWLPCACSSIGAVTHTTATSVVVSGNNFRVLKTNVRGESYGFILFGVLPIVPATYADAMAVLHEGANIEGRPAALMNMAHDRSLLFLILFSIPRVTVTADVIEFTE